MTINNEYAYAAALLVFVISIIFIVVQIMISFPKIKGFLTYKWDSFAWRSPKGKQYYYFRNCHGQLKVSRFWWSKAVKKSKVE